MALESARGEVGTCSSDVIVVVRAASGGQSGEGTERETGAFARRATHRKRRGAVQVAYICEGRWISGDLERKTEEGN